jgi:hypothetical protein
MSCTRIICCKVSANPLLVAGRSKIVPVIYPSWRIDVYVTEDERKLSDYDLAAIKNVLANGSNRYFNMIVDRFLPSSNSAAKLDSGAGA